LLEIHKNEHCEAVSSREWEQMHRKSESQTGGWYVELGEVWMWKSVKLWWERMHITAGPGKEVVQFLRL